MTDHNNTLQTTTPFHPGERAVQKRLGVHEQIEPFARRVVRPFLPEEHRTFYGRLPFIVAAARDAEGRPWATLLAGRPGFVSSPAPTLLTIDAQLPAGDALQGALEAGADVGLLGIELATRRRNRVNGRVTPTASGLGVAVEQSFGNCPQHIRPRDWVELGDRAAPRTLHGVELGEAARRWIAGADTFFIASGHRGDGEAAYYGMDASHRGGEPGFVTVSDPRTLVFPDYAGNNHFNTIGNLVADPRLGLTFVDFEGGHLLELTGRASIDWGSPAVAAVPGARRLVTVHIDKVVEVFNALPIRWAKPGNALRSLRVVRKTRESADVTSFLLAPRDGGELATFEPGQHLPIELNIDGERVQRTYSLSAAPDAQRYRLSIKREPMGRASRFLHDEVQEGDLLAAGPPAGDFHLRPGSRPVVLVSAGVGITPMASMLGALSAAGDPRPVFFVHGARDGAHHPLAAEVRALSAAHRNATLHRSYSQPGKDDKRGHDYEQEGRVDAELISALVGGNLDADFYLCGPPAFVASLSDGLIAAGAPAAQIMSEAFGGS